MVLGEGMGDGNGEYEAEFESGTQAEPADQLVDPPLVSPTGSTGEPPGIRTALAPWAGRWGARWQLKGGRWSASRPGRGPPVVSPRRAFSNEGVYGAHVVRRFSGGAAAQVRHRQGSGGGR